MSARFKVYVKEETERLKIVNRRNWQVFREQPWKEMSGAFGDLGTFIPIFVALASGVEGNPSFESPISVSSTLVFSGLANILTGMFFGIPLPVQPMKAIAAVAIANLGTRNSFGAADLASAGLFVAGCVAIMSATGLLQIFTRTIPVPVVKGIQMGAGLSLAIKAISMLDPHIGFTNDSPADWAGVTAYALLLVLLLYVSTFQRFPFTLVVVGCLALLLGVNGIIDVILDWTGWRGEGIGIDWSGFSLWHPFPLILPAGSQFLRGAIDAGLGQLPLTTLNSIVAVVYLAQDLFPDVQTPTATTIGTSVAVMNLIGCWFRAMPVCHGSGGLAAQYRFGARSGASVIFLGAIKLVLGLFTSKMAVIFCREFPILVLALLLFLAGQELVKMGESINGEAAQDLWEEDDEGQEGEDGSLGGQSGAERTKKFKTLTQQEKTRRWTVMTATIIALLGAKNDGIGFIVGMVMHGVYNAHDWQMQRWQRREGQIRLEAQALGDEAQDNTA